MYKRTSNIILLFFLLSFLALVALLRVEAQTLVPAEIVGVRVTAEPVGNPLHVINYGSFKWAIYPKTANVDATTDYTTALLTNPVSRSAALDLYTIQLIGPTKADWLTKIEAAGLQVVQYVHPFTYVVYGDGVALSRAANYDFVLAQGTLAQDIQTVNLDDSRQNQPVTILAYRGGDVQSIADLLGIKLSEFVQLGDKWLAIDVVASADIYEQLLDLPAVYSLQSVAADGGSRNEMSAQANARNIVNGTVVTGYREWLAAVGVDGTGIIMANVDEGVDQNHPDLINRFLPPCSGESCINQSSSHGTHTAGIMAADGSSGITDSNGFLRGLGVAPGAQLFEQDYRTLFTQAGGLSQLIEESHTNGALLSSNSWGPAGTPRGYDADTLEVDISTRDADPATAGNQEFHYVLAFMNGNGGVSSQGSPDEAKNIITVGSTKMQASNGSQDSNFNDLSFNSAHGPALDGRSIPHIVAPGCRVDSTLTNGSHGLNCGTSMAAPQVAGSLGLFLQQYQMTFDVLPSVALSKAALMISADSLAGNEDADGGELGHPFDSKQGWGKLNLRNVLSPTVPVVYLDQPMLLTETGQTASFSMQTVDENEPVRVMLVWTDAPGHGMGGTQPAWSNDLDLQVTFGGETYLGNQFGDDGFSIVDGSADFRNNSEAVFLPIPLPTGNPPNTGRAASFTLSVIASNLTSDGVSNNDTPIDQDFAIVCSNCQLDENPEPVVTLEKSFEPATILPGEMMTVTLTHTVSLIGENPYTFTVTDTMPFGTTMAHEATVDTTSVRFNDGRVIWSAEGTMRDQVVSILSYQVKTSEDHIRMQMDILTPYEVTTNVAGQVVQHGATNSYYINGYKLYMPLILRE